MKRFIVLCTAMQVAAAATFACDMCGGGAANQYIGLLPGFSRNFAGVQYLSGRYSGTFPSILTDINGVDRTEDYYNTIQAWARHRIGKHYQVFAFVPYQCNVRYENSARSVVSGLGDIILMVNRVFIDADAGLWKHTLFGGTGIKLPTGNSGGASDGALPAMDPGTGTWDITANGNYTVQHGKVGLNADVSYVANTVAKDKYKFGNRVTTGLTAFYAIQLKDIRVTPQAGFREEYAAEDYYNYDRGWLNTGSGGSVLSATAGTLIGYKNYGLRINYLLPISQKYAAGQVVVNHKAEAGFFILF